MLPLLAPAHASEIWSTRVAGTLQNCPRVPGYNAVQNSAHGLWVLVLLRPGQREKQPGHGHASRLCRAEPHRFGDPRHATFHNKILQVAYRVLPKWSECHQRTTT
eukprot:1742507-Rhodomonas_salina.1